MEMKMFTTRLQSIVLLLSIVITPAITEALAKKKTTFTAPPVKTGFVKVPATSTSSAIEIFYRLQGTGSQTIVLLHGYLLDSTAWKCNMSALANKFKVLAIDMRGNGKSSKVGPYIPDNFANDLKTVLHTLNIKKPIVVGYSLGGNVALKFAIKYPNLLSKLVLTNTSPKFVNSNCLAGIIPSGPNAWCFGLDPIVVTGIITTMKANFLAGALQLAALATATETCVQQVTNLTLFALPILNADIPQAQVAIAEQYIVPVDLRSGLTAIKVPTLIFGGCNDHVCPHPASQYMRSKIPNSKLVNFNRAHTIALFSSAQFNNLVTRFALNQPIAENFNCSLLNAPCGNCFA